MEEECQENANGFRSISVGDAIINCMLVVDGFVLKTITPSAKEVDNQKAYFSEHYACYGKPPAMLIIGFLLWKL